MNDITAGGATVQVKQDCNTAKKFKHYKGWTTGSQAVQVKQDSNTAKKFKHYKGWTTGSQAVQVKQDCNTAKVKALFRTVNRKLDYAGKAGLQHS